MADRKTGAIDLVWHALPVEQVQRHFEVDPQRGLDAGAGRRAPARHGPDALPEAPPRPPWRTFVRQLKSLLIDILFVAAVLAVAPGHHGEAMVVLAVVLVNALIGSLQEGRAERSMAALRRLAALRVHVQRDGSEQVVEARELVPGDTVPLPPASLLPLRGLASVVRRAEEARKLCVRMARGSCT